MLNLLVILIGSSLGSFICCTAQRLPKRRFKDAHSVCDHCHRRLRWFELIPIVSYLGLRGRSRCCHQLIDPWFLLAECLGALAAIWTVHLPNYQTQVLFAAWFICLIFASFTDHYYLFIYPIIWVPLFLLTWWIQGNPPASQIVVTLICLSLFSLISWLTKSLGMGDVEMLSLIALFWGLELLILTLFIGSGVALSYLLWKKQIKYVQQPIAFIPYLSIGFAIALLTTYF